MPMRNYQMRRLICLAQISAQAQLLILFTHQTELVGFQLNGSSDNMMLDGLPGLQLMID